MINLKDLLKAGVHFGHKTSRWSPKMNPFIWGSKNKIHLINIAKTSFLLERSGKFLKDVASQGKCILFIGTKKAAQKIVFDIASKLKSPYVTNRWIGGTLTNFGQVKKAITRLLHLRDVVAKPTEHYKKKELSMIQKEIGRLEKNIGGILDLTYPPGAIIVVDAKKERSSIREAVNANIPIISMVDTNTDPSGINFVIPANDDSSRSITFVLEYLAAMIEEGQKIYKEAKKAKETEKELATKARSAAKATIKKTAEKKATPAPTKKVEKKEAVKTVEKKAAPVKTATKTAPVKVVKKSEETFNVEAAKTVEKKEVKAAPVKTVPVKAAPVKTAPKKSTEEVKTKTTKKVVTTKTSDKKSTTAKKTTTKKVAAKKTTAKKIVKK